MPTRKPCEWCSQGILLAVGPRGGTVPLDPEPSPRGTMILLGEAAGTLTRGQVEGMRAAGKPLYQHHRHSCPRAREWAKGDDHEPRFRKRR